MRPARMLYAARSGERCWAARDRRSRPRRPPSRPRPTGPARRAAQRRRLRGARQATAPVADRTAAPPVAPRPARRSPANPARGTGPPGERPRAPAGQREPAAESGEPATVARPTPRPESGTTAAPCTAACRRPPNAAAGPVDNLALWTAPGEPRNVLRWDGRTSLRNRA